MISINAMMTSQAASSTFTSYPKASQNQSLTTSNAELYLIPIFVVLGVIIGSVVAWIGWGCLTRKPRIRDFDGDEISGIKRMTRRPRRSELEVGPVYCPSLSEARDYPESTEKQPLSLSMFSWHALDVDDTKDGKERDYLVPPALPSKKLRTKSVGSSKHLSRAATTKTATSMSVYSQVGEQEQELCEEDDRISFLNDFESDYDPCSPRPGGKSIATATPTSSTRVVSVSRRRPTHTRADSDCRLNDAGGGRVGGPRDKKDDLRRSATSRTQGSTCTTQTGFRIVDGSPLPTPAISRKQSEKVAGFFWGNNEPEDCGTSSRPGNRGRSKTNAISVSSDSYTTLPIRGSRSRSNSPVKKSVTTRSANKQRHVSTRDKAIEEYYGNALPQSPPQITSPKLNTSLCFTPPLN
ncbi:hypothetical protein BDP27DRAFT_224967 [Rhodocollybia butyracea]|uniref:Uncharacterized protein n=1 Tax=Rhodocollybia butyracea TaxID=206335 RepID=A0A9P5Q411_9AGAR|nr:hypothetical protein BDP27DRAFT_224967 [Rhodocollybia butyracea]